MRAAALVVGLALLVAAPPPAAADVATARQKLVRGDYRGAIAEVGSATSG
jgi:hypothetical protein